MINLRETASAGFAYTVSDERGETVSSGTYGAVNLGYDGQAVCRTFFGADLTAAHTYTMTVTPIDAEGTAMEDTDTGNNSCSVQTAARAQIAQTNFLPDRNGTTTLEALLTNTGAAPVESMTVEVYRAYSSFKTVGDVLISKTFENICAGSYRQILLENVDSNVYYKVILSDGEKILDKQMLMLMDEDATQLQISYTVVEKAQACVELASQGDTTNARIVLALYDETTGQLLAAYTQELQGEYNAAFDRNEDMNGKAYRVFLLDGNRFAPLGTSSSGIVDTSG